MLAPAVLLLIAMAGAALVIHSMLAPYLGSFIAWAIAVALTLSIYTKILIRR